MNTRVFGSLLITILGLLPSFAAEPNLATLQRQAAKGDAEAELDLGRDYQLGRGVAPDFAKAAQYYKQAAAKGNAKAMFNLGYIYRHGQGIAEDNATANQWFQKAADQGLPAGQLAIGMAYYFGDSGLPKDYTAAVKWLTLAAKQTDFPAQSAPAANALGTIYELGMTVPQDGKQAAFWYGQAAEMGNAKGQSNLGKLDYEGLLVKGDRIEGYKWMKLAAAQGEQLAIHSLSEYMVANVFTPKEIAEGDQRVADYQLKHHRPPIKTVPFAVEPETEGPIPPGLTPPPGATHMPGTGATNATPGASSMGH